MATVEINTRIQHKHDIEANWQQAVDFIPLAGELIIYDIDENYDYQRTKIGDGATPITELPFAVINSNNVLYKTEQNLTAEEKQIVLTNLGLANITPIPAASAIEPKVEDIPKVFIDGVIPSTKDDVNAELTYISKTLTFHAYITIKCQGNSSMSYPKKNFTIKLFEDADRTEKLKVNLKGWGKQNKFVLKANWIDISHLRNIVSARIWGDIVKSRPNYEEYPEEL